MINSEYLNKLSPQSLRRSRSLTSTSSPLRYSAAAEKKISFKRSISTIGNGGVNNNNNRNIKILSNQVNQEFNSSNSNSSNNTFLFDSEKTFSNNSTGDYDRFIPSRHGVHEYRTEFDVNTESPTKKRISLKRSNTENITNDSFPTSQDAYNMVLRTELIPSTSSFTSSPTKSPMKNNSSNSESPNTNDSLFKYRRQVSTSMLSSSSPVSEIGGRIGKVYRDYTGTPVRKIATNAVKVLDAPSILNDFYLSLLDWSIRNVVAVALTFDIYLWNGNDQTVTKLCSYESTEELVTTLCWSINGTHLSIGLSSGRLEIWDCIALKCVRKADLHQKRINCMSWTSHSLCTGSKDKMIYQLDPGASELVINKLVGHKDEVCGLKWSHDQRQLASGGNDNLMLLWDSLNPKKIAHKFTCHNSAVKALAWSPHRPGLLASGGGSGDKKIRFFNTHNYRILDSVDTGSQVCQLAWSKSTNELVSTHGYSQNDIKVWQYPSLRKIATLEGHASRVLYLSMSPDGSIIITGAGDETLRFFSVFPSKKKADTDFNFSGVSGIR